MMLIPDYSEREEALNPEQSFIIEAPAGSGKTELLIQRYLALLARVERPENILAITFTRKAANEMRERILNALEKALRPATSKEDKTWHLATQALKQDKKQNWEILENPERLSVQTIDSFCSLLTHRLPLHSKLNRDFKIAEDPSSLYKTAINRCFHLLTQPKIDDDFSNLMLHLDNRWEKLANMLSELLAKRDHWLPFLFYLQNPAALREHLEKSLERTHLLLFKEIDSVFKIKKIDLHLLPLLQFAANQVEENHAIEIWKNKTHFPSIHRTESTYWQSLADFLLTKEGFFKKRVNIKDGFPPNDKKNPYNDLFNQHKENMTELLESLRENKELETLLQELRTLPPLQYSERQWQILISLLKLLPLAIHELKQVFHEENKTDFTEITLNALSALGAEEDPTDLALHLDYQIQHILIDEFQDTSFTQLRLLEKLTHHWQPEDGKTLFLVGDPMQSIYRFRNAEVGLFLQLKKNTALNQIKLTPINLKANFRSSPFLVTWFNEQFKIIFPSEPNPYTGAVSHIPSQAMSNEKNSSVVFCTACKTSIDEAEKLASTVMAIQQNNPNDSIAILVQTRSQLKEIIPILNEKNLIYSAVELSSLKDEELIMDLLSLTKALMNLSDRVAWLSILRAPWCGLRLADLTLLSKEPKEKTIWENLNNSALLNELQKETQHRVDHFKKCISSALEYWYRIPLPKIIENTWINLGGELLIKNHKELENKNSFFKLLTKLTTQTLLPDLKELENGLNRLFAESSKNPNAIQIMTIHKAKGLEFDHVILPGLEKTKRSEQGPLLRFTERASETSLPDLILAPIKSYEENEDLTYSYLNYLEKKRLSHERKRLFYVACTRAKKSLYLFASEQNKKSFDSFLSYLKIEEKNEPTIKDDPTPKKPKTLLVRITDKHIQSIVEKPLTLQTKDTIHLENSQNRLDRIFGTVFHVAIFQLAEKKVGDFKITEEQKQQWLTLIKQHYISHTESERLLKKLIGTIENLLSDPQGLWILGKKSYSANELALQNEKGTFIVDRFFIEDDGSAWIIDYKTSAPQSEDLNTFLQNQKALYQSQLDHYYDLIEAYLPSIPTPVKTLQTALYFPLIKTLLKITA